MAFSFYIKPPFTFSSHSPINSRSSHQVSGEVFLDLSPNRHKCVSHTFSRLYLIPRGWTSAGHCSMARQGPEGWGSSQSPQGAYFHVGQEGCEHSTVPAALLMQCRCLWSFGMLWLSARSSASWWHHSTRREIISDCYRVLQQKLSQGSCSILASAPRSITHHLQRPLSLLSEEVEDLVFSSLCTMSAAWGMNTQPSSPVPTQPVLPSSRQIH